jgi:hypothetical protein
VRAVRRRRWRGRARAERDTGVLSSHLHADGSYRRILEVPGRVANGVVEGKPFLTMDGHAVFKFAVKVLADVAQEALVANGMTAQAIDWLIPHQANIRIMDATAKKLGMPLSKLISTVDPSRQHVGGIDSAGTRCRCARRSNKARSERHAGGSRWWIYVGLGVAEMVRMRS